MIFINKNYILKFICYNVCLGGYMFKDIAVLFISIIFEALPFLLLGSFISAVIQEFVSDEFFKKVIPNNPVLGSIVGVILGFFIPACDCAVIPIALRLKKKKVPLNVCIAFMLASPIINPVAILSLVYSFKNVMPEMILWRLIGGVIVSIVVGIIMGVLYRNDDIFKDGVNIEHGCGCGCGCGYDHDHEHEHGHDCECEHDEHDYHSHHENKTAFGRCLHVIDHCKGDFLDVIKFMIFGSLITAVMQVFIAKFNISLGANNTILQMIIMMVFAYVVSLCSTADSLIAKTFVYEIGKTSILAYLILGPMIDIKNTLYLADKCKKNFVAKFVIILFVVIFAVSLLVGHVFGG